jgi:hypothetical protein
MKLSQDAVANWGTGQDTNADSSAGYSQFASNEATAVLIVNNAGTAIDIRKNGGTDSPLEIAAGVSVLVPLVDNTDEVEWKRADDAASSSTISFKWHI